jgi:hypothetical protein
MAGPRPAPGRESLDAVAGERPRTRSAPMTPSWFSPPRSYECSARTHSSDFGTVAIVFAAKQQPSPRRWRAEAALLPDTMGHDSLGAEPGERPAVRAGAADAHASVGTVGHPDLAPRDQSRGIGGRDHGTESTAASRPTGATMPRTTNGMGARTSSRGRWPADSTNAGRG